MAVYSFVTDEDSDQRDELAPEAYGLALPDGRAVTYCLHPDARTPQLHVWPSVDRAARFWGAYVLWGSRTIERAP